MSEHPTDHELIEFARHQLSGNRVVAVDDHLAGCSACRTRAAALGGAVRAAASLRSDVLALDAHLSDDELHQYVSGDVSAAVRTRVARHLGECQACAEAVEDLRRFAAARSSQRPRAYLYLAAAAAILLLALSALMVSNWMDRETPGGAEAFAGLEALPAGEQARVRAAIDAGVVELPTSLSEMVAASERLMSADAEQPFRLIAPLATYTVSDRPVFEWQAMPGVEEYSIAVFTADLESVAGPVRVTSTTWTPSEPLARGREYVWQVEARRGREAFTAPMPPAPPARFRVMDAQSAATLTRISREQPDAHLVLGILFAQAGARDEAEHHFLRVPRDGPYAAFARRMREHLRASGEVR